MNKINPKFVVNSLFVLSVMFLIYPHSSSAQMGTPINTSPANGSFLPTNSTPTLNWQAVSGATHYLLDISEDPNFSWHWNSGQPFTWPDLAGAGGTTGTTLSFSNVVNTQYSQGRPAPNSPVPGRTYYWRIFPFNVNTLELGTHSQVWSFAVSPSSQPTSSLFPTKRNVDYYFDGSTNEFVLENKQAMDFRAARGIWLSNKKIKVYRNVHGSNYLPSSFADMGRSSAYSLDPLSEVSPTFSGSSGVVYVKERDTGSIWSNNPYHTQINEQRFESRVGLGYTKEGVSFNNTEIQVTYFVPDYSQSEPVIIQSVQIRNTNNVTKEYDLVSFHELSSVGAAQYDSSQNALQVSLSSSREMFLTSTESLTGVESSKNVFFGLGGETNPQALANGTISRQPSSSGQALIGQTRVSLNPGEIKTLTFVIGVAKNSSERNQLISKYRNAQNTNEALAVTKSNYLNRTNRIPGVNNLSSARSAQTKILGFSAISTSLWWDPFIGKPALSQMGQYQSSVNARDTAQIALGLTYMDPSLAKEGLESYFHSQQSPTGQIKPWGYATMGSSASRKNPDSVLNSDMHAWMALASCEYTRVTGDRQWLNSFLSYNDDSTNESVYRHIARGLKYDFENNLKSHGLLDANGGDWLDAMADGVANHSESVYSSILLSQAVSKCLPYMETSGGVAGNDKDYFAQKNSTLKNNIETHGYDSRTGRYVRLILPNSFQSVTKVGSGDDNRIFPDLSVVGFGSGFQSDRVRNTLLASYQINQNSQNTGNLVYWPLYPSETGLGSFTNPTHMYGNKVWGRICAVVSAGLHLQGLTGEARDNYEKCLPDNQHSRLRQIGDLTYTAPFNYVEYFDPRGNIRFVGTFQTGKTIMETSVSDAVDDAMMVWAQAIMSGPSATPEPTPTPPMIRPADINSDGRIDIFDYNILVGDFNKRSGSLTNPRSDINKDGIVDVFDYNNLITNFGS